MPQPPQTEENSSGCGLSEKNSSLLSSSNCRHEKITRLTPASTKKYGRGEEIVRTTPLIRNILFTTDLSSGGIEAAQQAARQAHSEKARLIVLYSYSTRQPAPEEGTEIEPEIAAQTRLDSLAQQLHHQFGISVTRLLKPNVNNADIESIAIQVKADHIILGPGFTVTPEAATFGTKSTFTAPAEAKN